MTLATVGQMVWPGTLPWNIASRTSTLSQTNLTFDSTTDRLAWVGRMPAKVTSNDTLSKVYFRTGVVTTGDTVQVQIETVTNGKPSGTIYSAGANTTVAIANTDDQVWKTATIATPPNIPAGGEFAIVITHSSGAVPNQQFAAANSSLGSNVGQYPVSLQDTGAGTWSDIVTQLEWIVELTTDGVIYLPGLSPLDGGGTITSITNATGTNERALKFVPPMKCRAIGMRVVMFNIAAGADFTFSIWDSTDNPGNNPTPLAQQSEDGDFPIAVTTDGAVDLMFPTPVTLTAGTTYYAGCRADTANAIGIGELTTASVTNAIRAFGLGTITGNLATRAWATLDPGAWTSTTTTLPMIAIIIDQLDDGAAAFYKPVLRRA